MKWFTSEPPADTPILCKFKDKFGPCFYICTRDSWYDNVYKTIVLVEAYGEQYMRWPVDELIAWTTFEELEKDFANACPEKLF